MLLQSRSFSCRLCQNMVDVMCLRFPASETSAIYIYFYLNFGWWSHALQKKNTTCSNDLPMLALEFTKGATKSKASTRTSKIPPRPRRNSYLNHWESTYAIISLSWREFFLICIVPVKTFHCLLHLFALFTKFRIRSWFLLLDYQSFLGKPKSRKIDSRFTRGLPRLECPPGVRWGKMKSSCFLKNLEKYAEKFVRYHAITVTWDHNIANQHKTINPTK